MTKRPTSTTDDRTYEGLPILIGRGKTGKLLVDLARPFVVADSLAVAYAGVSAAKARDAEADEWCESLVGDGLDAEG